jgi:REP element-mobilizing transposase RayT
MKFNPDIHHRRTIRLKEYDYASVGAYFVTICTQNREILFGDIHDGEMVLNDAGRMVADLWLRLPEKYPEIVLGEFVIMPNHFHGIIFITETYIHEFNKGNIVGAPLAAPAFDVQKCNNGPENNGAASSAPTLGKIMRAFKSMSAIEINRILDCKGRPLWQRNYYERIIRDDQELVGIREYIHFNPANWADDEENADV